MNKFWCAVVTGLLVYVVGVQGAFAAGYNSPFQDKLLEQSYTLHKYDSVRVLHVDKTGYWYAGTGWFIDANTVVTAYHTVDAGPINRIAIETEEDFAMVPVTQKYVDKDKDIMFLTVDTVANKSVPLIKEPARFGLVSSLKQGDTMYAVGYPRSEDGQRTYTWGPYLSAHHLIDWGGRTTLSGYADLEVTPGFSGAPLITAEGKVAGMLQGYSADNPSVGVFLPYWDILKAYTGYRKQEESKPGVPAIVKGTVVTSSKTK